MSDVSNANDRMFPTTLPGLTKAKRSWHSNRLRALRYIGSKVRIAPKIAEVLHSTGAQSVVDVFG